MDNNISFTSYLRAGSRSDFLSAALQAGRNNHVGSPWLLKDSVVAPSAYTREVMDCTLAAVTDGQKVLLMHLHPLHDATPEQIAKYIERNMDVNSPNLQAIVISGKDTPVSQASQKRIIKVINGFKIPLTELTTSIDLCSLDVAYRSVKDEWIISCKKIDELLQQGIKNSLEIFKKIFKTVKIADCDEVI